MGLFNRKKKQSKNLQELEEKIANMIQKTPLQTPQSIPEEGEPTQQVEKINYPFLTRKTWLGRTLVVTPEELRKQEPLLFYMTEEKNIFTYKKQLTGTFNPQNEEKKDREVRNVILGRKQCRLHYGKIPILCYVHYELETYSYPHEPIKDAEQDAKLIKQLQLSYKDLAESRALDDKWGDKKLIKILKIVGIAIGIGLGAWWVIKNLILTGDSTTTTTIAKNVTEIAKNYTIINI